MTALYVQVDDILKANPERVPWRPVVGGDCGCIWCAHCTDYPSRPRWPAPKPTNGQVLLDLLDDPDLARQIPGTTLIADKNYYGRDFETAITAAGLTLLHPTRKGESPRSGERFFKPLRQTVESVFDTFKGQLDLEHHGGRTAAGVLTWIWQCVLALTAAVWHNVIIGAAIKRSLIAYDH